MYFKACFLNNDWKRAVLLTKVLADLMPLPTGCCGGKQRELDAS